MFTCIQINNGVISSLNLVASSIEETNKLLKNHLSQNNLSQNNDEKEKKVLESATQPIEIVELVDPQFSLENSIKYKNDLEKLADGQEFLINVTAPAASITTVNVETRSETSTNQSSSTTTPATYAVNLTPETSNQGKAQTWKKYKKVVVTTSSWGLFGSTETKTAAEELVAEYQIVQLDYNVFNTFIAASHKQEEEVKVDEEIKNSKRSLNFICSEYEVDKSKNCITYLEACEIGRQIREVMFDEDVDELYDWCTNKLNNVRVECSRADILNLLGYINYFYLNEEDVANNYFLLSAKLGYPLAIGNLIKYSKNLSSKDINKWRAQLTKSTYVCNF
jgi:hypothetical protein